MISPSTVGRLLGPVLAWLEHGGDAWELDLEYWRTHGALMEEGASLDGFGWELISNIDAAMDVFSPRPDRDPDEIDERQLRLELLAAVQGLRELGLLADT